MSTEDLLLHITVKEPQLAQLLQEYADIFKEPKSLPPHRSHDHRIVLKEGTSPINVRPYRYPALQKEVIEQTVKEMLEADLLDTLKVLTLLLLC